MRLARILVWALVSVLLLAYGGQECEAACHVPESQSSTTLEQIATTDGSYGFALSQPLNCGYSCESCAQGAVSHASWRKGVGGSQQMYVAAAQAVQKVWIALFVKSLRAWHYKYNIFIRILLI